MKKLILFAAILFCSVLQAQDWHFNGVIIPGQTTDPTGINAGQITWDTDDFKFRYYNGTTWEDLTSETSSEWYEYTDTRAADLVVKIGDYDSSSNGFHTITSVEEQLFQVVSDAYVGGAFTATPISMSIYDETGAGPGGFTASFSSQNTDITGNRVYDIPDASGVLALEADASGFTGNLTTSDNTLQEIADAVDGLVVGGDVSVNGTPVGGQLAVWWTGTPATIRGDGALWYTDAAVKVLSAGLDDTDPGSFRGWGGSASAGGSVFLYSGATGDTFTEYYKIENTQGNFSITDETVDVLEYNTQDNDWMMSDYGGGTVTAGYPTYNLQVNSQGVIVETGAVLNDVSTSRAIISTDSENIITLNNAGAVAVTIPSNAAVDFPIGTKITLINIGAGTVTVGITDDTLSNNVGGLTLAQYDKRTLTKITATNWILGY